MDGLDLTLIDKTGMLIGSWLTSLTYGILLLQIVLYIRSKAADPLLLRATVGLLFCLDTAWNVLLLVSTYRQLITVSSTSLDVYLPSLTFVCIPFLLAVVLLGVNVFMVWRYQKFTKRAWLCYGLYMISIVTFISYMWSISLSIKLRNFDMVNIQRYIEDYKIAAKVSKAGLIMELVMVCTIWILLLVALLGYLRKEMLGARRIVMRLLSVTAETGTIATVSCITQLIYYFKHPSSSNVIVIAAFTARVYYMGMLLALNMRGNGGQVMQDGSNSRVSGAFGGSNGLPLSHIRSTGGTSSSHFHKVIHVSQDTAMHSDKHEESDGSGNDKSVIFR